MDRTPDEGANRFFRFRRTAMDRIVADREMMLRQAQARAEAAERDLEELRRELDEARQQQARHDEELSALRARIEEASRTDDAAAAVTSQQLSEQVRSILASAERTAQDIIQRAREDTDERGREVDEMWRDLQTQVARLAAWRDKVDPLVRSVRVRLEELRHLVDEVPDRLTDALGPLAAGVQQARADIDELADAGQPPLLLTPGAGDRTASAEAATRSGDEVEELRRIGESGPGV
jgi:chromosome segregation ATPase